MSTNFSNTLRAANNKTGYRKRCCLEGDHLVIKGKHYNRDNIEELPEGISGYKITSKEDPNTVGFFGELNAFSNFHRSHFVVHNQWFHCTEQYIQHKKAKYFNDRLTLLKILASESAIECKQLARSIKNYDNYKWKEVAESECYEGILEKFNQNPNLNKVLQNTANKTIAESCYNRIWGTGVPLHSPDALNTDYWAGENIMGKILAMVRETLRNLEEVEEFQFQSHHSQKQQSNL